MLCMMRQLRHAPHENQRQAQRPPARPVCRLSGPMKKPHPAGRGDRNAAQRSSYVRALRPVAVS
jgi:hypothetical protein